jgi:hypothetical protein
MPPLYSFRCECGKTEDAYRKVEDRNNFPECHGPMKRIIGNYNVVPDLEPYIDEHLGDKPLWVKSKQHRKKLMKEHGVYEKLGKGWM